MVNFGYSISKSGSIDLDKIDSSIAIEVQKFEPSFAICIGCGTCTGVCSAGIFTDYNLRKIQALVKRGQLDEVKRVLHKCMLCGKCQMACPRGVNTRNVVLSINKAIK